MDPNLVFIDFDPCDAAGVYDNTLLEDVPTHTNRLKLPIHTFVLNPTPKTPELTDPLKLHFSMRK
jgi:hypothetical protein